MVANNANADLIDIDRILIDYKEGRIAQAVGKEMIRSAFINLQGSEGFSQAMVDATATANGLGGGIFRDAAIQGATRRFLEEAIAANNNPVLEEAAILGLVKQDEDGRFTYQRTSGVFRGLTGTFRTLLYLQDYLQDRNQRSSQRSPQRFVQGKKWFGFDPFNLFVVFLAVAAAASVLRTRSIFLDTMGTIVACLDSLQKKTGGM